MSLRETRTYLAAAAVATAFAFIPAKLVVAADDTNKSDNKEAKSDTKEAAEKTDKANSDGRLSANEYFTLAPFVVPVIKAGEPQKQFTLIFAIELEEEDHRIELRRLSPKMRNEIYEMLFKLISFRTIEPRIPGNEVLRKHLTRVAQRVAGNEIVKSIYVHTANVTDIR